MARKRFVTSEISTDRKIAKLAEKNPVAAALWPWFITALDDWGRMNADPIEVKLMIFPAFPYTSDEVEEFIKLYHEFEIAHHYEVEGKSYLAVNPNTWLKYQTYIRKDKLEKQKSKIPEPKDAPWVAKDNTVDDLATKNVAKQQSATINVLSPSPSPSPSPSKDLKEGKSTSAEDESFEDGPSAKALPLSENDFNSLEHKKQLDLIINTYRKKFPLQIKEWGTAGIIKARNIFETAIAKGVYPHDLLVELWYWREAYPDKPDPPPWEIVQELVENCGNNQNHQTWAYCIYTQEMQAAERGFEKIAFG